MLPIGEAIARLSAIQQALEIESIVEMVEGVPTVVPAGDQPWSKIARVYYPAPDRSDAIETPCFLNEWTSPAITLGSAVLTGQFTIHSQLLIDDANESRAGAVANAYWEALLTALTQNVKLGAWGPATVRGLRGGDPTLTSIQFPPAQGAPVYIGLDLFIDLYLNKAATMRA